MSLPTLDGFNVGNKVKNEYSASTGQTVTLAAPYNWLVLTQTGTLAALTVVLPASPVDAQSITISAPQGAVTAMTFSPAVIGFSNASTWAIGTGHLIAYSAPLASWFLEV
jgi:hypothetical protein